ncbi:MAG: hypothetical protein DRN55_00795 [Thermoplasmata archaeon]|nr:MAG: hypothetical protein DRN55_00795 [Thermoplasmata archaeon]
MGFEHLDWIMRAEGCEINLTGSSLPPPEVEVSLRGVPSPPPHAGLDELREAVAERWGVEKEEVLITAGTSEANLIAVFILKERCERVAVEWPTYYPLRAMPELLSIPTYHLPRRAEGGFRLDLGEYRGDGVILSHLHNPTGAPLGEEAWRALQELEAPVLADEVYGMFHPLRGLAAELRGAMTTSSLSKTAGALGLRVGWLIADRETVKRALEIKNTISYMVNPHSQMAALRILQEEERHIRAWRGRLEGNFSELSQWARRRGMSLVGDGLAPISFLITPYFPNTRALAETLLERYSIGTIPGEVFSYPGGLRVYLGGERDGIKRFEEAIEEIIDVGLGEEKRTGS